MTRVTHEDRVEEYIKKRGSITSWEAIKEFGITRLSAVIYKLRNERDLEIETRYETMKNRYGDTVNFARYVYKGVSE